MALSALGALGSNNTKTSGTTLAITTEQATAAGDIVIVQMATDNSVSTVGATTTHTGIVDSAGNVYVKAGEQTNGTGGANAGVTLSLWRSVHTAPLPAGSAITFTRSGSVAARAGSARRFGRTPGSTLAFPTPVVNAQTGVPAALTISGMTANIEKLLVRAAAVESNAASIDTATSGWTLGLDVGTSGGQAAVNVSTRAEYIIGTATSYTSQPTGSNLQGASIMLAITETVVLAALTWGSGGSVPENSGNGTVVGVVSGGSGGSFSLFNDAGGRFAINATTGQVTVANSSLLDFETNTSHSITVRETYPGATTRDTVLSVTVTNVPSPTINSTANVSVAENSTLSHTLTTVGGVAGWAIESGVDAADFEISGSTLRWASNGTKDFEAPDDTGTNNIYDVTVRATENGEVATQNITVTVTDEAEGGGGSWTTTYTQNFNAAADNTRLADTYRSGGVYVATATPHLGDGWRFLSNSNVSDAEGTGEAQDYRIVGGNVVASYINSNGGVGVYARDMGVSSGRLRVVMPALVGDDQRFTLIIWAGGGFDGVVVHIRRIGWAASTQISIQNFNTGEAFGALMDSNVAPYDGEVLDAVFNSATKTVQVLMDGVSLGSRDVSAWTGDFARTWHGLAQYGGFPALGQTITKSVEFATWNAGAVTRRAARHSYWL